MSSQVNKSRYMKNSAHVLNIIVTCQFCKTCGMHMVKNAIYLTVLPVISTIMTKPLCLTICLVVMAS